MPVRRPALIVLTTAVGLAAALSPVLPAAAAPATRVVASGLDNPRQLTTGPGGAIYVAEAGRGGSGACLPNPEGDGEVCVGATGAVTRILRGSQQRVLTGLPSIAPADGSGAQGPADLAVTGNHVAVLIGFGGDPTARAGLGSGGSLLGTILAGTWGAPLAKVADPLAYEASANPDRGAFDTNPSGLLAQGRSGTYLVADAGGNDVVQVGRRSATVAVLDDRMVPAPPFLGLPPGAMMPMQPVATDVVRGPDGALYVSELTGFPFPAGASRIHRVVPGQAPTVWATGLTNVTSLAWSGGDLYAVQIADAGLLGAPVGSLRKVVPGASTHPVVAGGLFAPYGVAIHGSTAYVSTCSVCAHGGEVRAVTLG